MYKEICTGLLGGMLLTVVFPAWGNGIPADKQAFSQIPGETRSADDLTGRWDITIDQDGKSVPSWLEVKLSGNKTLVGYFVGVVGSARTVAVIHFKFGRFKSTFLHNGEGGEGTFILKGGFFAKGLEKHKLRKRVW